VPSHSTPIPNPLTPQAKNASRTRVPEKQQQPGAVLGWKLAIVVTANAVFSFHSLSTPLRSPHRPRAPAARRRAWDPSRGARWRRRSRGRACDRVCSCSVAPRGVALGAAVWASMLLMALPAASRIMLSVKRA